MPRCPRTAAPLALLAAAGCCGALPADLPARLAEAGPAERLLLEVRIESAALSGTFDGVLLVRPGPCPAVRLQLLPDMGTAILDVTAEPGRVEGWLGTGQPARTWIASADDPPPALPLLLGLTLLEQHAGLDPGRVRCFADVGDGEAELEVDGLFPGLAIEAARLGADGRVRARRFALGPVRWRDRVDRAAGRGEVVGPGVTVHALVREREGLSDDPAWFRLEADRRGRQ